MHISSLFEHMELKDIVKQVKPRTCKDIKDLIYEELKKCHLEDETKEKELAYRQGRKPKLYRKPSYPAICIKLSACKTVEELEWIHNYCKESKHYAKCFYAKTRTVDK